MWLLNLWEEKHLVSVVAEKIYGVLRKIYYGVLKKNGLLIADTKVERELDNPLAAVQMGIDLCESTRP